MIRRVAQIFAQFKREKNLVKYPEAFTGLLPLMLLILHIYKNLWWIKKNMQQSKYLCLRKSRTVGKPEEITLIS